MLTTLQLLAVSALAFSTGWLAALSWLHVMTRDRMRARIVEATYAEVQSSSLGHRIADQMLGPQP